MYSCNKALITPEYQKTLLDLHRNEWGVTGGKYAGDSIVKILEGFPEIETILDYGCGSASLMEYVKSKGFEKDWTLYDPGVFKYKKEPKGKFDLVITTDVLEHVEEPMLNNTIRKLQSLTGKYLLSEIACYFAGVKFKDGPYVGQDLHINVKAPDMWRVRLQHPSLKPIESFAYVLEGWKVRYFLLQEVI